jgi:hypothetical protein
VTPAGLDYSTTYYWHARAVNPYGTEYANGSPTAFWTFTTAAPEQVCPAGEHVVSILFDGFENEPSGRWTLTSASANEDWELKQDHPFEGSNHYFGKDNSFVTDFSLEMAADVSFPVGTDAYLRFKHELALERSEGNPDILYDAGIVEYSTNGGLDWIPLDFNAPSENGGHNGVVSASYGNPLAGKDAWSGYSEEYFTSEQEISFLAGQDFRIRFRVGTDSSVPAVGWYIDNVQIYTCTPDGIALPVLSMDD